MKSVRYTADAAKDLKRHGNMAARIRKAMTDYATGNGSHANNVIQMVGSTDKRMRIADFRVIFREDEAEITVVKIAPRGGVYE